MNKNTKNTQHSRPALTDQTPADIPEDFSFNLTPSGFRVTHQVPTITLINMLFSAIASMVKDNSDFYQPVATATSNLLAYCFPTEVFPSREELLREMEQEENQLKERVANGEGADIDFSFLREKKLKEIQALHEKQRQEEVQTLLANQEDDLK